MLEEAMEKSGFWILAGGGTAMVILGYVWSKKQGWDVLPLWQLIIMILVIWGASVVFAAKD